MVLVRGKGHKVCDKHGNSGSNSIVLVRGKGHKECVKHGISGSNSMVYCKYEARDIRYAISMGLAEVILWY